MPFDEELRIAIEAARQAGDRIRKDYESFPPIPYAPASISTATDRDTQEMILRNLQDAFPEDALCAEEKTPTLQAAKRTGSRIWIVDPIDGTRGFAMKNGEFSVMIGLIVDGEIEVGVVLEPVLQRLTYATKGGGCWSAIDGESPKKVQVSNVATLCESILVQSRSKSLRDSSAPVKSLLPNRVVEMYSAGVKLALVARGDAELYVNTYCNFSDWDICAGHILVTEAGGIVTTLHGSGIRYCLPDHSQRGGLLATNGRVHDDAVRLLKEAGIG